ncbi:Lactoylglutathione lyase [Labilithrix luteola]|uniref:Lactoylglutathione lyase n=1 Tax=Labilithrix luteola TaxID=1391654 RepID=A0A0K1PXR9_9BACT|nr:VOC family protein [Labilithrix luteola]AKU98186.1 Lactoylglutathione lyase [Labilithrix luteola]
MKQTAIVALDHISVPVRDLKTARSFYKAALGALGMKINMEVDDAFGMGSKKEKIFWLVRDKKATGDGHYALRVDSRDEVNAFYAAAIRAGGKNNGKPGLRPNYGPNYYAAFVTDREGNNIEVVCYANVRSLGKTNGSSRRVTGRPAKRAMASRQRASAAAKRTGSTSSRSTSGTKRSSGVRRAAKRRSHSKSSRRR